MFTTKFRALALLFVAACISFTSCDDDDPVIENEEELITTVLLVLTPEGGGDPVRLTFSDIDGDGPLAPTPIDTAELDSSASYTCIIAFSNASDPSDVEDITAEINDEALEHQVFYVPTDGLNAEFAYTDMDANGNPLGLRTTMTTGTASTGSIRVVLRHEPTKGTAATISNPDAAMGSTDVEVLFPVKID